ncbi:class I SAM-dependent methyltransferase [Rhodobacteraceae bacterium NNCM2]|nr:class I SAM-dependent methyltransferase [Coraliihabitans acroporae]
MSFSADWLSLRVEADKAARNRDLASRLEAHFAGRSSLRVLDLGAGTGSNMRLTSRHLPPGQHWILADADAALLERAEASAGVSHEGRVCDLATDVDALLKEAPDLVTASALFDLCGADWLDDFAAKLAARGAAFYAVLNYDGREEWAPTHPDDAAVLAAFHADQRRDKGLGPSLGPSAHDHLAGALRNAGFDVHEGASDWHLRQPRDGALIVALAEGTGAVAGNTGWTEARRTAEAVMIGHKDLLALPR